jgi:hypothetical protein
MKTLADLKEIRYKAKEKMKLRGSDTRIKIVSAYLAAKGN